jgi:hypothetical protein
MATEPLSERELRILRAMVDEYERRFARNQMVAGWGRDARSLLAVVGAVMLIAMQIAEIWLILHGYR